MMAKSKYDALRKDSTLTAERFELLQRALDSDPETAAVRYEQIRRALIEFFEFRNLSEPEAAADETFDRAARRLSEGQQITTANPAEYFYGIARFVWREKLASRRQLVPLDEIEPHTALTPHTLLESREAQAEHEQRLAHLRQCLQTLAEDERALVLDYYRETGRTKIEARRALAETLGIPVTTLHLRMFRLREKLERCVKRRRKNRF